MAAWIASDAVATLLQTDLGDDSHIDALIAHAQALAEIEIGAQASPGAGLQAALAQIVARMWQAGQSAQINPAALTQDQVGPFGFQNPNAGAAGLGLTNREKALLRKAVGKGDLYVQPTTRGDRLETAPIHDELEDPNDPVDSLAGAQADMTTPTA
jgi:hypothetical protein